MFKAKVPMLACSCIRANPVIFGNYYGMFQLLSKNTELQQNKLNIPISCPTGVENGFPSKSEKKFVTFEKSIMMLWM